MGRPIKLFNNGQMGREFTYINDVVEAVAWLVVRPPEANPAWTAEAPDPATSQAPWRVYNIGNSKSVEVEQVVRLIEQIFGKSAIRELLPMQPGNVSGNLRGCFSRPAWRFSSSYPSRMDLHGR